MSSAQTSCSSNWDYHNSLSFPESCQSITRSVARVNFLKHTLPLKQQPYVVFLLLKTLDSSSFHSEMASNGLKGPTQLDPMLFLTPSPPTFLLFCLFQPDWPPCIFWNMPGAL